MRITHKGHGTMDKSNLAAFGPDDVGALLRHGGEAEWQKHETAKTKNAAILSSMAYSERQVIKRVEGILKKR